jgi:hypothetical protein
MKKAFLFLLLATGLAACKSTSTPSPDINNATVKYSYSSGSKATYKVEYTGADGNPVDTTYTGTSFVKIITTNRASGFKIAYFKLTAVVNLPIPRIEGEMTIYRNDSLDALYDVFIDQNSNSYTSSLSASVFN